MKKNEIKVVSIIKIKDIEELRKAVTAKVSKILNLDQIHMVKKVEL